MAHLCGLATPDTPVPSSPTLSPAVVTHTTATTRHLHSNDTSTVDLTELTKLLQKAASSRSNWPFINTAARPVSPASTSTSSSSSSSSTPSESCTALPSQFVFKKPEYNEQYHRNHFHRPCCERRDAFLGWYDLRRFFVSEQQQQQQQQPPSPSSSSTCSSLSDHDTTFGNQIRQDIEGRYGRWGKFYHHHHLSKICSLPPPPP